MEEMQDQEAPKMSAVEEEEQSLSHTDNIVGVFSEPVATFGKMSKFPPKTIDWILPILIVMIVAFLSSVIMMSNPEIKMSVIEKQMKNIEKNFDEAVAKGQMTESQKNDQMEMIRERMNQQGGVQLILQGFGIVVVTFIIFFVVSGVFFLIAKFGLKGEGTYKEAMVAYGLPHYIVVIQVILMVIAALVLNRALSGLSVGAFMEADGLTITGWLLNKLDIFSIWFYAVVGIGFAKMFKSDDVKKYVMVVIGVWLLVGLLFFYIAKAVPFLRFFAGA